MLDRLFKITVFVVGILAGSMVLVAAAQVDGDSTVVKTDEDGLMYIVYDSSGSMWGELEDKSRKYEAGRSALSALLDTDLGGREIAFRAYGHREKADCRDSELIVPFSTQGAAKPKIKDAVANIRPTGKTPISYSLREALKDFDGRAGDILLISDGIETCDIDPCELMREWQASNVNIRVHVVGVGLTEFEREAMACIAKTSGGKYFDADSAEGFVEALTEASVAIEKPAASEELETGDASPMEPAARYALIIKGVDETGRVFRLTGKYSKDGEDLGVITSTGRHGVDGVGDYEVEVGALLQDGTAYKPVKMPVSVKEPGDTVVEVLVTRPAVVSAKFVENGEGHPGSFVKAYQNGVEVFGFRSFDEALARPGEYEFRAEPNNDNKLSLTEPLVEGEHTELVFDLTTTIGFYIEFVLPDGEIFRRGSELWRDGERVYKVFGSRNPTTIIPGVYELRADDQNLPLTPVEIDLTEDGKTYQVPIKAGWIKIHYNPSEFDYVGNKPPTNAFLESLDRGNSKYSRVDVPIPVKPGRYQVNPRTEKGFMDPIEVTVANNETVDVAFTPKPVGELVVNFMPSDKWTREPDRSSVYALDGQRIIKGYMVPGRALKFAPGRYRVVGGGTGGSDAVEQEVVVTAHVTTTVTLKHKDD